MSQLLSEIFQRVRTYKISTWPYHNSNLNPYLLASLGYICVELNKIQCSICHHQVIIDDSNQSILEQIDEHENECIYKGQQQFQITKQKLYLKMDDLATERKWNNDNNTTKIIYPYINYQSFIHQLGSDKYTLFKIMEKYGMTSQQFKITFILQFMGWRNIEQNGQQSIQCYFCGRSIKSSDYDCTYQDKQKSSQNKQKQFECFKEHRYFCLWVGGIQGWKMYLQHLWDKLAECDSLFKRQKPQQKKKVRVMMDQYLKNFQSKTKEMFQRVNNVISQCKLLSIHIQGQTEAQQQKINQTLQLIQNFNNQVEDNIRKPLKKIKID